MNKYTLQEEIKKADSFTMSVFYNSKKLFQSFHLAHLHTLIHKAESDLYPEES